MRTTAVYGTAVVVLEPGAWLVPFRLSAVLLVAMSGLGALVGGGGARALAPADEDTIRKPRGRREGTEMNEIMNPYLWRQRREDTRREAGRDRLVRALRAERKRCTFSLAWELGRMAGLLLKFFRRLESRNGARP